ncbi:tetratricopeptide repeat protein [Celeribacter arenosi]|uniref:Tetratricopeptide repeat protein n=1 Tax=Celeribacter arenosi TaxID=792649 RepID=A0ABP7K5T7_9RHOB
MSFNLSAKAAGLAVCAFLALSGCQSSEEKAAEFYQNGLNLMESGDYDRAVIEFRNVFKVDASHREARHALAKILLEQRNDKRGAYGQYLRLAEQFPEDLEARLFLAEIAFDAGDMEEVERHTEMAYKLDPNNKRVQALNIVQAYRNAILAQDSEGRSDQAAKARSLLSSLPDSFLLRNLIIDDDIRSGNLTTALAGVDWMLERDRTDIRFWRQRLGILNEMNDFDGVEAHLIEMVEQFPDDTANKATLVRFYLSRQQNDKAESFLRDLAEADPENSAASMDLVRFISELRGEEAARAELKRLIEDRADPLPYVTLDAGFDFAAGRQEEAIAALEGVLEGREPSNDTRQIKVALAQMLAQMGNEVGARARVEEILAEAPTNPEALKMKAAWLTQSDDTDGAIAALRTAMEQKPDDPDAMSLMAEAYARAGRQELANDFLALAVETSGNAPIETIRYAQVLIGKGNHIGAEDILLPALKLAPQNLDLLSTLGSLYVTMEDFGRVQSVAETLRRIGSPEAVRVANSLDAARITEQSGPAEAVAFIEGLASSADADVSAKIALVRARLATGDTEQALQLARDLSADAPDDTLLRTILASTEAVAGNVDTAEGIYRDILKTAPERSDIWLELSRIMGRKADPEGARAVVEEGLAILPEDPNLLWANASFLERAGQIDEAIDIYETLYAENPNSIVIANNYASMLSTYRDDPDSLEKAWVVARRFSESPVAQMQDTYGWIIHKRGQSADALPYLEAAARSIPDDALVQYHLAEIYNALGRKEEAIAQFELTLDVAGPADQREQIETARAQLQALRASAEAGAEAGAEN